MKIEIANRWKPYSHEPGTRSLIPHTTYVVEVFPTRFVVYDLFAGEMIKIDEKLLPFTGPVEKFTVQQDLERGAVTFWGHAIEGYFHYSLFKNPTDGTLVFTRETEAPLPRANPLVERLSLGSHKAQEWSGIRKRAAMEEVFPFWLRLGQTIAQEERLSIFDKTPKNEIVPYFRTIFLAHFRDLFFPTLIDDQFHGIKTALPENCSPLFLLSEGARLIRSLFVEQKGNQITLFPSLPCQFPHGRMTHISLNGIGTFDIEWQKGKLRRAVLRATEVADVDLLVLNKTPSFRLRESRHEKGKICSGAFSVLPGKEYFLDRF